MELETEFRIRLQLHQLLIASCHAVVCGMRYRSARSASDLASTWVTLSQANASVWSDEALLLCQTSADEWLAWVPDYGEITLTIDSFSF